MKKSTETLAIEIEAAIQLIVTATRDATLAAVEEAFRALVGPASSSLTNAGQSTSRRGAGVQRRSSCHRRSAAEISAVGERLLASLRENPGKTMVELAQSVDAQPSELTVPMAQLKRDGRIKAIGKRQFMRYYPRTDAPPDVTAIQAAA